MSNGQIYKVLFRRGIVGVVCVTSFLCLANVALAVDKPLQNETNLFEKYKKNAAKLDRNESGVQVLVESYEQNNKIHVDAYGIISHSFPSVADAIQSPSSWCDIVFLHPNIKACTNKEANGARQLTFYLGRKYYQAPEETRQVSYRYNYSEQQSGYLDLLLAADEGPYGTKNHRIRVEALRLDGAKTLVRVECSYEGTAALRLVEKIYFATLGRGKVGFTVTGAEKDGSPIYIGGPRGAVERNAVRFLLAMQTYLDSLGSSQESRHSNRLNVWYDSILKYRRQLVDIEKQDYLSAKEKEHKNQLLLQQKIGTALQ